jgi:hypothetical protein
MRRLLPLLLLAAVIACGDKKADDKTEKDLAKDAPDAAPEVAEIAAPELGVDNPAAFHYLYGKGDKEWKKAEPALKAKDWVTVAAAAEATLAKDPGHLDALHWLAVARAQQKQWDKVGEPLAKALAGDWLRFGPTLAADKDLAEFLATPHGAKLKAVADKLGEEFDRRAGKGLTLLGRKTQYRPPAKSGIQPVTSRAELYAFDPETQRYLRLTETGGRLVAWLPAPSGEQIAIVSVSKIALPADPKLLEQNAVSMAEVKVGVLPWPLTTAKLGEAKPKTKDAVFKDVRAVTVAWDVGDRLVVTTQAGKGRWELADPKPFAVDPVTGQAKAAKQAPVGVPAVTVTYDDVAVTSPTDVGVEADWGERDAASTFRIPQTQKTVSLPAGEAAARESFVVSPNKSRLVFATFADPCAEAEGERLASLYLVEAATGKLKHLGDGKGAFRARWLTEDWLAYEDDAGGLRLVDAAQGKETLRLASRGGLALTGVGAAPLGVSLCKKQKVAYEPLPPEGELPPEE